MSLSDVVEGCLDEEDDGDRRPEDAVACFGGGEGIPVSDVVVKGCLVGGAAVVVGCP